MTKKKSKSKNNKTPEIDNKVGDDEEINSKNESDLEQKLKDAENKLLLAAADSENLRKRFEREKEDLSSYVITKFATEILSFLDNLQRALSSIDIEKSKEKDESISHFIEGIELTEKQVVEIFKKFNIEKINSLNEVSDPNLHQAMFEVEKEDMEPGYVAEVVQEGYMIGERLLRPAMVGVSKKKTQ